MKNITYDDVMRIIMQYDNLMSKTAFDSIQRELKELFCEDMSYEDSIKLFSDILFDKEKTKQFLEECEIIGIDYE
jgi:Mg/Co/Ni transporter MgtE